MSEAPNKKAFNLGVYNRRADARGLSNAELIALALSAVWLAAIAFFFYGCWPIEHGR